MSSAEQPPAWLHTIVRSIGDARAILIGEATHGSEEFYRVRCLISKYLIEHHGVSLIGVEGDWPDIYRLNRYVQLHPKADKSAAEAMGSLERFPTWMWRNEPVREFIEWLRAHNAAIRERQLRQHAAEVEKYGCESFDKHKHEPLVGFYGLDLYSLFTSCGEVLKYLKAHNPDAAKAAARSYATLQQFQEEAAEYGLAVSYGLVESQQKQVVSVLRDLLTNGMRYAQQQGLADGDELVYAKLNAAVVSDAERYYAATLAGGAKTWNLRDHHMTDTLLTLLQVYTDRKLEAAGQLPKDAAAHRALQLEQKEAIRHVLRAPSHALAKAVVWAHNSHLGDARATMQGSRSREVNIGQLTREKLGLTSVYSIGFSTNDGTVSAARRWGADRETMSVNPGLDGSYEKLFHQVAELQPTTPNFLIMLRSNTQETQAAIHEPAIRVLSQPRYQRAIGVQYVKATEFYSHYFKADLPSQFDCMLHFDSTNALEPLLSVAREREVEKAAEDAGAKPQEPADQWDEAMLVQEEIDA